MEVIFDSGSTYTHLPEDLQAQLVAAVGYAPNHSAISQVSCMITDIIRYKTHDMWWILQLKASLSRSLKEVRDPSQLHPCWKGPGGFKSSDDLKKEFKSVMSLKFHNGATMIIPPEKYFIVTVNT